MSKQRDTHDHWFNLAKREGYRSRAAYKLEEIQRRERLLHPGARVADLGCWPGGWMQVAARLVGPSGRVVGVDRAEIDPPLELANARALCADLEDPGVAELLLEALGGPADVVLCDAAPKLTGIRASDRAPTPEPRIRAIQARMSEVSTRARAPRPSVSPWCSVMKARNSTTSPR